MISQAATTLQRSSWRSALADLVTSPQELFEMLSLSPSQDWDLGSEKKPFPLRVPREFVQRMRPGDPDDPLLRQVLPLQAESERTSGYSLDPLAEITAEATPGLLQKYRGRALLVLTGVCAIHCRYCFRRHFPYADSSVGSHHLAETMSALAADQSISEVILSGGDPLMLGDDYLRDCVKRLESMPHLTRLRIHTRLPIVIPSRVDDEMLAWLSGTRFNTVIVVHVNHANELDGSVASALAALDKVGVTLLNQAVLLKGVNDNVEALQNLSIRLFENKVLPYYLHLLDKVQGAAHFDVDEATARQLIEAVRAQLPGYLVPRLAQEVAAQPAKMVLA